MSLATNLANQTTRIATEMKSLRTLINANQPDLSGLSTTAKTNLVAAINELDAAVDAIIASGSATALSALTDVTLASPATGHILRHNGSRWVNVLGSSEFDANGAAAAAQAASQPLDSDLTAIAALSTTAYGRALLQLADNAAFLGLIPSATEALKGIVELATAAETLTGTDTTRAVHPAGLKPLLDAKASTTALKAVAFSGSASDLTGLLPTASLPPLAVTSVSVVANQAAMLALTAQEGDVAKRTDNGRTYFLAASPASTLANWIEVTASGDVTSVAGKVGAVTLAKTDVGLGNVDNTTDAAKPISTLTQNALNAKQSLDATLTALAALTTAANQMIYSTGVDTFAMSAITAFGRSLIDDADAATARTTIDVYSKAEIGNPEQDLVAIFNAALV